MGDSLWVGTSGGLYIYDLGLGELAGYTGVGASLPSNSVRAIAERNDTVFVGTDAGLTLFYADTIEVFTPSSPGLFTGAPLDHIRRIDFGLDDTIYLSTYGRGLAVLNRDSSWVVTREDTLLDDKVFGMVQEDDTTFYFVTSMGLCAFRDSVWVNFQAGAGIPRAEITQIVPASEGGYYLLVAGRGVYLFDGVRARRVTFRDLFPENEVAAIVVDSRGTLWACGRHGGIAAYRNGHWTEVDQDNPIYGKRRWRSACADTVGSVFFGSADGTVLTIRDNVINSFSLPAGLPSGRVTDIVSDSSGVVYLLNGSYLLRLTDGIGTVSIEHPSPVVIDIAVSPSGELWTATRWGIYRSVDGSYVEFTQRPEQREPVYSAIGFDARGALWAGVENGSVHRFDGQIWMRLADAGELKAGSARFFCAHPSGGMWIVGSDGGAARYLGGRWLDFDRSVFDDRPVQDLSVSPAGIPVAATDYNIWGYDEQDGWKTVAFGYDPADSTAQTGWDRSSPTIHAIQFDPAGRLYVATEKGIAIIEQEGLRWLTTGQGLGGEAVISLLVAPDSALWAGFRTDGVTRFDPGY